MKKYRMVMSINLYIMMIFIPSTIFIISLLINHQFQTALLLGILLVIASFVLFFKRKSFFSYIVFTDYSIAIKYKNIILKEFEYKKIKSIKAINNRIIVITDDIIYEPSLADMKNWYLNQKHNIVLVLNENMCGHIKQIDCKIDDKEKLLEKFQILL